MKNTAEIKPSVGCFVKLEFSKDGAVSCLGWTRCSWKSAPPASSEPTCYFSKSKWVVERLPSPRPSSESTFRTLGATPLQPAATAGKRVLSNSKRKLSNTDTARNISWHLPFRCQLINGANQPQKAPFFLPCIAGRRLVDNWYFSKEEAGEGEEEGGKWLLQS